MNEGWGASANKTHLFNWLHNMTVQMAQRVGVVSAAFPFLPAGVCVSEWPMLALTVGCIITTGHGSTPETKRKSLIRKKALLLLAGI